MCPPEFRRAERLNSWAAWRLAATALVNAVLTERAHVRTLFNKLDHWIERRIWSHRYKRWRNCGWEQLPKRKVYGEYELVQLVKLIPSIASQNKAPS
jgi:hypothetical protein